MTRVVSIRRAAILRAQTLAREMMQRDKSLKFMDAYRLVLGDPENADLARTIGAPLGGHEDRAAVQVEDDGTLTKRDAAWMQIEAAGTVLRERMPHLGHDQRVAVVLKSPRGRAWAAAYYAAEGGER